MVFGVRMWRRGPAAPDGHVGVGDANGSWAAWTVSRRSAPRSWASSSNPGRSPPRPPSSSCTRTDSVLVVAIAFALFTIASTATVGLMFLYYARYPGEAQAQLTALRDRVVAAGPAVGAVAGTLVGGFLIADAVLSLT